MFRNATIGLLLILTAFQVKATHIIGGEMIYTCLGNNNYRITLKVYRDCFNGVPQLDDPAPIGIYSSQGVLVQTLMASNPVITNIPPVVANPCLAVPPNVCVEEGVYIIDVNLPPINGGYTLVYQRCCRNNSILNIVNPGDVGATYTAFIPGPEVTCNSSPRFNYFPPVALCANDPLSFDHSAIDPDGDVLVYSLCDPYEGASVSAPAPNPPAGPPFNNVIFATPFSASSPLAGNPGLSIDPNTGLLTGTPNLLGQFVVAVCVSEYRNGVLIDVHKRDFQFNVVNCLSDVAAAFINPNPDPLNSCNGFDIQFTNQSTSASDYHWDFGVPGTNADTSNEVNPIFTYPAPGQYTVTLIANPNYICADTTTITFGVFPALVAQFDPPAGQCITGNSFNFVAGGTFQNDTQFSWDFGPQGSPQTSNAQNPTGISYPAPGTYGVTVTYTGQGCVRTYTDSVVVYPLPTIGLTIPNGNGCEPFPMQFTNTSTQSGSPLQYLWDFGDGFTSTDADPIHVYEYYGLYSVTLTAYSLAGCIDTLTLFRPDLILVKPSPVAAFTIDPLVTDVLNPLVTITDQSVGGIFCQLYLGFGTDTLITCNTSYNYTDSGTYYIAQIVINEYGCPDTLIQPVRINPIFTFYAPNAFTPNNDIYNEGFRVYGEGIKTFNLIIFNRWGQQVFNSTNILEQWDGTLFNNGGKPSPDGVYVYAAYITDVFNEEHVYRGMVVLIR